jgi:hypothetical protein
MFLLNKYILVMLLCAAFVSGYAKSSATLESADGNYPPTSVKFTGFQGEKVRDFADQGYKPQCTIEVWIPFEGVGTVKYSLWMWATYGGDNIPRCWGAPAGIVWTPAEKFEQARNIALAAPAMPLSSILYGYYGECSVTVWWGVGYNGAQRVISNCTPISTSTSCAADVPPTVEHPANTTGHIRSTQRANLHLRCDGRTSVTVSVPESDLVLRKGESTIATKFFIGEHGQTSTNLTVANEGIVSLLSVIDSQGGDVGTYIGSVVVNVTWD